MCNESGWHKGLERECVFIHFSDRFPPMKRLWLVFAQSVTVLLAAYFVVGTLKPEWLGRRPGSGAIALIEAPTANNSSAPVAGSFSAAAKKASPAVVSINTSK